jgi:hypothetical protein
MNEETKINELQEKIKNLLEQKEQEEQETEEQEIEEQEREETKINIENEDLRKFSEIINLPYSLLSEYDEVFKLSEKEAEINSYLCYLVLVYYSDKIDLGKLSLYFLILYNISLITIKTIQFFKKRRKELKKEKKQMKKVKRTKNE